MSLLKYMKHKDGLPDPKGLCLLFYHPERSLRQMEKVKRSGKKRGPYKRSVLLLFIISYI